MHFSRDVFSRPFPLRKAAYIAGLRNSAKGQLGIETYFRRTISSSFASLLRLVVVMFHEHNRKIAKLDRFCVTLFARGWKLEMHCHFSHHMQRT